MLIKKIAPVVILLAAATAMFAQDPLSQTATAQPSPTPDAQPQQEEKAKLEKKALALLEQVVSDSQALKLPENRLRVQVNAADLLWDRNPVRARSLLTNAGAVYNQMALEVDRTDRDDMQVLAQLRQELVLTAGRHDADLGYQLLRSTQTDAISNANQGNGRRFGFDNQAALEQSLLATVAVTDPKVAYQKVTESLDKGEYPSAITRVLSLLQAKDQDTYKKLADKTLNRLGSENLLTSRDATSLATALLMGGPLVPNPANSSSSATQSSQPANQNTTIVAGRNSMPALTESAYKDLLNNAMTAALTTTSVSNPGNRGGGQYRIRGPQANQQNPPDEATVRQNNASSLLFSLQAILPQIDQYDPDHAQALRQKLTELGMNNNAMTNFGAQMRAMQQGTSDSLVNAASTAPPQMQSRLYQQAAQKAIDEGNPDRAAQIAADHLDESARNSIMQAIDFKRLTTTASDDKINEIKQKLAALPSDSDRVKYLIELATATQKDNPKLALRFLDDARNLVTKRATDYSDFENQIKVARAYSTVDPKRSFELMELGINQINELLQAATVLNGFEVDIFKQGELSLRNGSDLVGWVNRYSIELAGLAKVDFDQARMAADKFQLPEPRMNARLTIVEGILGTQPVANYNSRRPNIQFLRGN